MKKETIKCSSCMRDIPFSSKESECIICKTTQKYVGIEWLIVAITSFFVMFVGCAVAIVILMLDGN